MNVNEKIKIFLNEIDEVRQITPSGKPIRISYNTAKTKGLDNDFVHTYLKKLEQEYKIIKILNLGTPVVGFVIGGGNYNPDEHHHVFELKEGFAEYCSQTIHQPVNNNIEQEKVNSKNELRITYSEHSRKILINNFFLIANPDFDSENEQVFFYLYKNPNILIKKGELMEDLKVSLTKELPKIVENLNFTKAFRKAFFDVSQDSIRFYNPVSEQRLKELGITELPIQAK